jgi:fructose/tagatose bisphosphate aldolase
VNVLREVLERAQTDGKAVAHFNVCDLVLLKAVFSAARADASASDSECV